MPDGWFRRQRSSVSKRSLQAAVEAIPEGLWTQCPKCRELLFTRELEKSLKVCKKCNYHFPLTASERRALFDALLSVSEWIKVYYLWRPNLPDEGDNHLIELAVAGGAGFEAAGGAAAGAGSGVAVTTTTTGVAVGALCAACAACATRITSNSLLGCPRPSISHSLS